MIGYLTHYIYIIYTQYLLVWSTFLAERTFTQGIEYWYKAISAYGRVLDPLYFYAVIMRKINFE